MTMNLHKFLLIINNSCIQDTIENIILITGMIIKYENTHFEINIERAVFEYNYKITTRTPFVFAYLNLY